MVKLKAILMIKTMHLMSVMLKPMLMKIDQVWLQETREPSKELKIEMLLQHHPKSPHLSAGQAVDLHLSAENIDLTGIFN